jgi:abortive infection bacteriophage resistance protein
MNRLQLYNKPYVAPSQLVNDYLINQKGLFIKDEDISFAEKILSQINWYHLKIYFYPYLDRNSETEKYKEGTTFYHGWNNYLLDESLRTILIKHTLNIELIVKSFLDQCITEFCNDPFWYLNDDLFLKGEQPYFERNQILDKIKRSDAEFAKHFRENYKSPLISYRLLPPFWIAMELISFDQLLKIIEKLNYQSFSKDGKNALDMCSEKLNCNSFTELKNWLKIVKNIRNLACHNNRIWNAKHMTPKGFESSLGLRGKVNYLNPKRIYLTIIVIFLLTKGRFNNGNNIKGDLINLIAGYKDQIDNLEKQMGFPENWDKENIWF